MYTKMYAANRCLLKIISRDLCKLFVRNLTPEQLFRVHFHTLQCNYGFSERQHNICCMPKSTNKNPLKWRFCNSNWESVLYLHILRLISSGIGLRLGSRSRRMLPVEQDITGIAFMILEQSKIVLLHVQR